MTLLTPREAREQICPLIRYCINQNAVVQYGASAIYVNQSCQGPDCKIGWRFVEAVPGPRARRHRSADGIHRSETTLAEIEPPRPKDVPDDWEWVASDDGSRLARRYGYWIEPQASVESDLRESLESMRGFCGAFGKVG